jgi:EAL and modified HD-GYP domain-containing signal transduction protein
VNGYYIHKEPVLDRKKAVFGYRLYFRQAGTGPTWPVVTIDQGVIEAVALGGGFEKLVGVKPAFLDVDLAMTDLDALRAFPNGSVFQVTERDGLDKDVIVKSGVLRKQNYRIAVDHSGRTMALLPLHQAADFVRVNALSLDADQLSATVALFDKLPIKLAVYNVSENGAFEHFEKLGVELFEGPFFIQPLKLFLRLRRFLCSCQTI